MEATLPLDEVGRQRALRRYNILDTTAEEVFDDLTYLAASICGTSVALLTFADENRYWFKSAVGLDLREIPRDASFCRYTIAQRDVLEVPDALADERFVDNPFVVGEPHVRFYAGVPLVSAEGYPIGAMCVLDSQTRQLTDQQHEALKRLGRQVMSCLEARLIVQNQESEFLLEESDGPYRSLFDSARDGIFILDTMTRRIIDVNPALEKLLALPRQECRGCTLEEVGLIRSDVENHYALAEANNTDYLNVEKMELRTHTGQAREVELLWSAYGPEGSGAMQCNVRDITARSEAEARLRESEERYRLLLESVEDYAIYMLTPDGRIASWNAGAQRLKGYSADEIIGQPMSRFYVPEEIAAGKPELDIQMALQVGRYEEEGYRVRKNGERFWAQVLIAEVRDEAGVLRGFSKVTRDITERKMAQEALERSNIEMRTVWESITDSFMQVDPDWIITRVNDQAVKLLQVPREVMVGKNMWDLFPWALDLSFPRYLQQAIDTQLSVSFEEKNIPRNLWLEVHAYPSALGLSIYFRDITERREAVEALKQSEARFQDIVANAPGMVYQFVLHTNGSVEVPFVNEGSLRLLEASPQDVMESGGNIAQIIHPDDRSSWQISVVQSAATLSPWEWEGRIQLPSGKVKWVNGAARPRRLPDGSTLWHGLLTDITERRRAEEDRDRFFTLSLDMLCIVDGRGFFRRLNPAFEETLGFPSSELMSRSMVDYVHPDDQPKTRMMLQSLVADPSPQQLMARFRCRDGSYKWLSWRSTPFEGLNYASARDITALKGAEDELHRANIELERANLELDMRVARRTAELARTNEELQLEMRARQEAVQGNLESYSLLNAIIEGSTDSIFVKDLQGRYLMINSAGARNSGKSVAEIVGKTDSDLIDPERAALVAQSDNEVLASGASMTYEQGELVDGEWRTMLVNKRVHRNPQGDAIGLVVMARDVTALKQQADALKIAKEEADKANQAKSEFLSRMSHELRTPLNAILGFGQILELNAPSAEAKAAVTQILKGGWHLLDLVNEVLEISRFEAGHVDLSLEPISLADVVPESCALVRPLADQRGIRLNDNQADQCEFFVLADRQRLKQVLINLLSNAIKYNFANGLVDVSCIVKDNGNIRIAVRDTGPGISEQNRSKLFTPFERLGAAHSKIEGSGLGLALSLGLLQAMGGTLGLDSPEEGGSIFWVELPATESPLQTMVISPAEVIEPENVSSDEHTYTVLSIEDNLSNLWLLEAILARRPDINLLAAMQGSMGLEMAQQHLPDLILLDLNLPDIYGADVLAELQKDERTANIPVIVISADATPTQIERLMRAGARSYLTKPLNVSKFLRTMDDALAMQRPLDVTRPEEPTVTPIPPQEKELTSSALRVLLVEDNPVNQQVALHQLGKLGHEVTVVGSGEEALDTWQQKEFAVMLLDCNLPGIDGYETAREIRLLERELGRKHIPIIALTATATGADRERCLAAGMNDYVSKPVKQSELAAVIEKWTSGVPFPDDKGAQDPILSDDRWTELHNELDAELVQELVVLFLAEVPPLLAQLREAVKENNLKEVRSVAHQLKGSCATMGVARMAALCRDIENCATSELTESLSSLVEQLAVEFDSAQGALESRNSA